MKIKLPKNNLTLDRVKQLNKKTLSEDLERDGILAKVLVFIQLNEPASNDDIKDGLMKYYFVEYDKTKIKNATKRLHDLGMVQAVTSGELMTMPPNERTELYETAYKKFLAYLDHIPKQFRRNYDKVKYYWIANKVGEEYVEWACNILGFEVEK